MANLLFKKGSYEDFVTKVLNDTTSNKDGILYLTEDERSLYVGVGTNAVRLQGTVQYFADLGDFRDSVTPPYASDVIYFIGGEANALVRFDAATNSWIQLNTTGADAKKLQDAINKNITDIGDILTTLGTVNSDITTLKSDVSTLKSDVAGLKANAALGSDLNKLTERVAKNEGDISTINNTLETLATTEALNTLAGQVGTNSTNIGALQTTVGEHGTAIASKASTEDLNKLTERVGKNETDIASKASTEALNNVKSTAEDAAAQAGTNKTSIENLTSVVNGKASQSDLDGVAGRVGTLETKVGTLETNIGNKVEVSDFNGLKDRVTTAEGTIGSHTTLIGDLRTDLTNLNTTVSGKADASTVNALTNTVNGKADKSVVEELSGTVSTQGQSITDLQTEVAKKVNAVEGKGLSTNDFTDAYMQKLTEIEAGANKTIVDTALSETSTNPVENKVIAAELKDLKGTVESHTTTLGQLDSTYVKQSDYSVDKEALNKDIEALKTALGTGTEKSVAERVAALETDNDTNKTDISNLKTGVSDLQTNLGTTNTNLTNLTNTVNGIDGRVGTLETDNTNNKKDIADLKTKTDNTNTAVSGLTTRVGNAETAISDIQKALPDYAKAADVEQMKKDLQDEIDNDIKAANAMTYQGKAETEEDLPTADVHIGDTWVVSGEEGFNGYHPGDILIAQGTEVNGVIDPDTLVWDHVETGFSGVYNPELVAEANKVVLKDYAGTALGAVEIKSLSKNIIVNTDSNVITLDFQWDTF